MSGLLSICLPCLSVPPPVRPVACLSNIRMVLRRGRFLRSLHSDSLERSSLHDTDALCFLYRVSSLTVFNIDVLFTCVFDL